MSVILCDIEGTTTPLSFVHDVLFQYVLDRLHEFLDTRWSEPAMQDDYLPALKKQAHLDGCDIEMKITAKDKTALTSLISYIRGLMAEDRKVTALKALQGYIWQAGYEAGELKGTVYEDVHRAFERWQKAGVPVYIYSSGSIVAQKLIFGYSDQGDLLPFISGHFDATTGNKMESESYVRIAEHIGVASIGDVLFLSDNPKELAAASGAGMKIALLVRPGNHPLDSQTMSQYPVVFSFDELP